MKIKKMMRRRMLLSLPLLILASCTDHDRKNDPMQKAGTAETGIPKATASISAIDTIVKLDFFKTVPDTIDGCSESFTYDTCKVANNRYIFLSNFTGFAIIKINGKDIYLNRDTAESKVIDDKRYIAVYKGHGYKAVLAVKETKMYDEGGLYTGTLQIIAGKIKTTFKVHGEAGC